MRKQRINAGQMTAKVIKYSLENGTLMPCGIFRARLTKRPSRCVYSRLGRGADSTTVLEFYSYVGLSPSNLLMIDGHRYAVSFVTEQDNKIYSEALCGRCHIVRCRVFIHTTVYDAELRRPKHTEGEVRTFDAVLCEKYIRTEEARQYNTDAREYVLMFPQNVELKLMDIIEADGTEYYVRELSRADFWNEAVIAVRSDV